MNVIPLNPVPSQVVQTILGDQLCQIKVYQKAFGLFVDLYVDHVLIIGGVIAENFNRVVRSAYLGFLGDLVFMDNTGDNSDPDYTGLGTIYSLIYVEAAELLDLASVK